MAGAHCATFSFPIPTNQLNSIRTKRLLVASIPNPSPSISRPTKRKNYLRPKILKTLIKPKSNPLIPIISPQISPPDELGAEFEPPSVQIPTDFRLPMAEQSDNDEEFRVSETAEQDRGSFSSKFDIRGVMKYGVYFVGIFVIQTICAVWILGSSNSDEKDKVSTGPSSDINSSSRIVRDFLLNGNRGRILHGDFGSETSKLVYLDQSLLEEKIEEIRAMAREVRKAEKKQTLKDKGGDEVEHGNVVSRARIGIKKEIDAKLVNLQNRLSSSGRKNFQDSNVNYPNKSKKVEDEALNLKKKFKFKNPLDQEKKSPKGFQGLKQNGASKRKKGGLERLQQEKKEEVILRESVFEAKENGDPRNSMMPESMSLGDDTEKMNESKKMNPSNGVVQDTPSVEVVKSRNSSDRRMQKSSESLFLEKGTRKTSTGNKKSGAQKVRVNQSNSDTDWWWLNLPYVLGILMRRGFDEEGQGGLFTLKTPSSQEPYTIAFEDRVDANNFCYLLESFFEDLRDFSADVVPLPVKELCEDVKSQTLKVFVVKKRQLQLYAGQPFSDVEMALHELVEQNLSRIQ